MAGFASRRVSREQLRGTYALGWFAPEVAVSQMLGSPETTAQVHPARYTRR